MHLVRCQPIDHGGGEFCEKIAEILKDDEAAQCEPLAYNLAHQHRETVWPAGQTGCIVLRDQSANRHASASIQQGQDRVKHSASDILKIAIDARRSRCLQLFAEICGLVVDAGVKTKLSIDFEIDPDRAGEPVYAQKSAIYFWLNLNLPTLSDAWLTDEATDTITLRKNRSTNSRDTRQKIIRGIRDGGRFDRICRFSVARPRFEDAE